MEVYVDDMIVKTKVATDHLSNLRETFDRLHFFQMKLNLQKSVFEAVFGKFLGFLVSRRGVEANLKKNKGDIRYETSRNSEGCTKAYRLNSLTGEICA